MVAAASVCFSSQSSTSIFFGFFSARPVKFPFCVNRSLTLMCHNPKLREPSNFTTSNLLTIDTRFDRPFAAGNTARSVRLVDRVTEQIVLLLLVVIRQTSSPASVDQLSAARTLQ
jgi:hypothetical protein